MRGGGGDWGKGGEEGRGGEGGGETKNEIES